MKKRSQSKFENLQQYPKMFKTDDIFEQQKIENYETGCFIALFGVLLKNVIIFIKSDSD